MCKLLMFSLVFVFLMQLHGSCFSLKSLTKHQQSINKKRLRIKISQASAQKQKKSESVRIKKNDKCPPLSP